MHVRLFARHGDGPAADARQGIGINERIALKGGILKHAHPTSGGAPPFGGELTDLGSSLRHACYKSALAVHDAGKPVRWNITPTEEGEELLASNAKRQSSKGLTVLEDWEFNAGDPILRPGTSRDA